MHSLCCGTLSTVYFHSVLQQPKRKPSTHLAITPMLPPPAPGNHLSAFCLYEFAYFGYFLKIESYNTWPFVSGFFHLA